MSDNEYTAAEADYFSSGGDASALLREQGRHQASPDASDGDPQLSRAEENYFRNGGDISAVDHEQLRRENGLSRPQPQERQVEFRPEVRDYVERLINHSNEQTLRAEKLDERNRMLIDALSPEQPQQQDHAWARQQERPDPNNDIFRG